MGETSDYNAAFAALIIAAAAFVIACLQTILQYISSAENRNKCSTAAIGCSHKNVKHRWRCRSWRLKVYYPVLDFQFDSILKMLLFSGEKVAVEKNLMCSFEPQGNKSWQWREIESDDNVNFWHVAENLSVMVKPKSSRSKGEPERLITFWDLNWCGKYRFLLWRWRHPMPSLRPRPRASWAQLFLALEVRDTSPLFLRYMDAESIPSSLDVPPQRVRLRDLGELALLLGFSSVSIDPDLRKFTATSPFATISTEEVQVLGKILRFEGDLLALHSYTCRCPPTYLLRGERLAMARISFGKYLTNGFAIPVELLANAMRKKMASSDYHTAEINDFLDDLGIPDTEVGTIKGGYLMKESARIKTVFYEYTIKQCKKTLPKEVYHYHTIEDGNEEILLEIGTLEQGPFETLLAEWQFYTGRTVPTIFVVSTMCSLHSVTCGFPSRAVLYNFVPWFRFRARKLYDRNLAAQQSKQPTIFFESSNLIIEMFRDAIGFARSNSHFLMSDKGGSDSGQYCWGTDYMKSYFDICPSVLQAEILYNQKAHAVLTRDIVAILKHFEVEGWLEYYTHSQQGSFSNLRPLNLLWTQIIILDIAIQYIIRDGWGIPDIDRDDPDSVFNEGWQQQEANVAFAITKSWRLPIESLTANKKGPPVYTDWNLANALEAHSGINADGDTAALQSRLQKLADLLELRGLVWIFFMLCHPDSSDVYLMADENIELPMV